MTSFEASIRSRLPLEKLSAVINTGSLDAALLLRI
jgi:hypothetical protein